MTSPIYLDHHASTPLDPRVAEAMVNAPPGNAASMHWAGAAAAQAVQKAREQVAALINAEAKAMVFTGGATEAINLAIQGVVRFGPGKHIITCRGEHPASLETCEALEKEGFAVTVLPVDPTGRVDPEAVRAAITDETVLINIMFANNEVGTLHDVSSIGAIAREHEVLFHCDACQAPCTEKIDVEAMHIDLLSLSAHKMYGPMGVGALFLRRRRPRVRLTPITFGGGHELGVRPGTINVPGVVGMGTACEIAGTEREGVRTQLSILRNELADQLQEKIPDLVINGHPEQRLPGNLNITFPGVESRSLLPGLMDRLAISSGSACTSALPEPSHVLRAMGLSSEAAAQTVRIGLGRGNTPTEVETAARLIAEQVQLLRG